MTTSKRARIWRRTWFGALLAGSTLGLILWAQGPLGTELTLGAGVLLAVLGLLELDRMGRVPASRLPSAGAAYALPAVAVGALYVVRPALFAELPWAGAQPDPLARTGTLLVTCLVAGLLCTPLAVLGRGRPRGVLFGSLWIVFPLTALALLRQGHGGGGLLALMLLAKIGDVAGYYVGNAIGRTHPFPRLSPGKTTEGCLGSLVAGVLVGLLCQQVGWLGVPRLGIASGILFGAALNLAAQSGDLLESLAKRRAGVKDSSPLFGPSGGTLDVVDSLLLAVPVALVVWPWLFEPSTPAAFTGP